MTLGARETRALLARHGLRPRTGLGQHFVVDPNTVRKVVRLARIAPGDRVLEVGAGIGALTRALVAAGARVTAVERDRALAPALAESLSGAPVRLVWGDALRLDLGALAGRSPCKMVSNLPYAIATPLVIRMLEECPAVREYTVMVQKEVGERLAATPRSSSYGAASVKVAYFARAQVLARVSRRAFFPVPEVDSVVVGLARRGRPPVTGVREAIFRVVDAGFSQRRKTVRNALRGGGWAPEAVERALARAGVDSGARAEVLSLTDLAAVARALGAAPRRGRER